MRIVLALPALLLMVVLPVQAGFDEGIVAYSRGDFANAVKEMQPLAEQGNAAAQVHLAGMFAAGHGVAKDDAEALKWYRKAADQGREEAQFGLGAMFAQGRGVPKDEAQSAVWYRKAAEQGYAPAQAMLSAIATGGGGRDITPPPEDLLYDKIVEVGRAMGWQKPIYENRAEGQVVWHVKLDQAGICDGAFGWHMKRVGNTVAIHDPVRQLVCRQATSDRRFQRIRQLSSVESNCLQEEVKRRWLALVGPVTITGTSAALPEKSMGDILDRWAKETESAANSQSTPSTWPASPPTTAADNAHARAQRFLFSGQTARAIEAWEDGLRTDADNRDMLAGIGAALYADNQFSRAAPYLERAAALNASDPTLKLFAATVNYLANQHDKAKADFDAIAKNAPNRGKAQIALDKLSGQYFRDQEIASKKSLSLVGADREPSPLWIGKFIEIPWAARNPELHDDGTTATLMEALLSRAAGILFLGKVSVVTGGDQIDLYGDARLRVISYAKNRYLVVMQAWKGRPEEKDWHSLEFRLLSFDLLLDAIRAGGGSVGRGSTVLTQKLQAVDAMRQGRLGVAADNITAALASAPEDAQALKISGMLYGAANKHDLALKAFNAVLERWPDDAEAHFYIAQIYSTQQRYQEAATILQKFVNVQPTDIESYLTIGRASCRLGKTSEGLSAIANARELNP